MDLHELIQNLEKSEAPSRRMDAMLALVAGWQRKASRSGGNVNVVWLFPGEEVNRLPEFTRSIDAALEFVGLIAPQRSLAFTWGNSIKAQIDDTIVEAINPAAALCLAALKFKAKQEPLDLRGD
ncbi:hypothetical protein CN151_10570 [Sinorhizobium meliloti]|uniref:hypothetical protein n=1 Tax=Rhizobium meliloti TaxID=382 RepID=UPI000FD38A55|nr:hypothetical protein [Sinorhizobium meliloti]RVL05081.1 hypothetical protein CN151_10570 [Sinorhizobium meliloti]